MKNCNIKINDNIFRRWTISLKCWDNNYSFNPGSDGRRPYRPCMWWPPSLPRSGDHRESQCFLTVSRRGRPMQSWAANRSASILARSSFLLIPWLCNGIWAEKACPKQIKANQNGNNIQSAYFDPVLCEWYKHELKSMFKSQDCVPYLCVWFAEQIHCKMTENQFKHTKLCNWWCYWIMNYRSHCLPQYRITTNTYCLTI